MCCVGGKVHTRVTRVVNSYQDGCERIYAKNGSVDENGL